MASRDSLRLADVIGFLVVVTIAILAWKWSPSSDDQNAKEWEVYKSCHKCESIKMPSHRPQHRPVQHGPKGNGAQAATCQSAAI